MKIKIRIKTLGPHLSTKTLSSITGDISKQLENSLLDAINEEFPFISKTKIKKGMRDYKIIEKTEIVNLRFDNVTKGSWELFISGSMSSAIGGVIAIILGDMITSSTLYKNIKNKVFSTSKHTGDHINERLSKRNKFGSLEIKKKKITLDKDKKGETTFNLDAELKVPKDKELDTPQDLDSIVDDLIKKLNKKPNKSSNLTDDKDSSSS